MKSDFRSDSLKKNSVEFFLSRYLSDALKGTQEIIPKMLLEYRNEETQIKI